MARMKKRKLGWTASTSPQVVGYKLYWADGEAVSYDSPSVVLGNVTKIVLPDDVEGFNPKGGPVEFGVTAMDELGNESDMVTFSAAYQFNVPKAPKDLWLEAMETFHAPEFRAAAKESSQPIQLFDNGPQEQKQPNSETHTAGTTESSISQQEAQYPERKEAE